MILALVLYFLEKRKENVKIVHLFNFENDFTLEWKKCFEKIRKSILFKEKVVCSSTDEYFY
jgi:hypothetical protein